MKQEFPCHRQQWPRLPTESRKHPEVEPKNETNDQVATTYMHVVQGFDTNFPIECPADQFCMHIQARLINVSQAYDIPEEPLKLSDL